MTDVMNDHPVSDLKEVPGNGVSVMAGIRDFPVLSTGSLFSEGTGMNELSCGAMQVPFWIVMAKNENSGMSAE